VGIKHFLAIYDDGEVGVFGTEELLRECIEEIPPKNQAEYILVVYEDYTTEKKDWKDYV
jgi:hypothetical protein